MPTETISLNSTTGQHITRAVTAESTLKCTKTSSPDVYVHGLSYGQQTSQQTLTLGDSMLVQKGTLTIWVFRKQGGTDAFSAELQLTPI